jgi:septal ring factor EnvC (AmiA/AmiB activator)
MGQQNREISKLWYCNRAMALEIAKLQVRDKEKEATIADMKYRHNLHEARLQTLEKEIKTVYRIVSRTETTSKGAIKALETRVDGVEKANQQNLNDMLALQSALKIVYKGTKRTAEETKKAGEEATKAVESAKKAGLDAQKFGERSEQTHTWLGHWHSHIQEFEQATGALVPRIEALEKGGRAVNGNGTIDSVASSAFEPRITELVSRLDASDQETARLHSQLAVLSHDLGKLMEERGEARRVESEAGKIWEELLQGGPETEPLKFGFSGAGGGYRRRLGAGKYGNSGFWSFRAERSGMRMEFPRLIGIS